MGIRILLGGNLNEFHTKPYNASPMIGRILKIGVLVVLGLVGYNYMFGDDAEKAQSREIIGKATDLGKDAWNLLKGEKQKMQAGKYDGALSKLGSLYDDLRGAATRLKDSDALERLQELDKTRKELQEELNSEDEAERKAATRKVDELTEATEDLMKKLEKAEQ